MRAWDGEIDGPPMVVTADQVSWEPAEDVSQGASENPIVCASHVDKVKNVRSIPHFGATGPCDKSLELQTLHSQFPDAKWVGIEYQYDLEAVRKAIWSIAQFTILRNDVHLLISGINSGWRGDETRRRLQAYADQIEAGPKIHFVSQPFTALIPHCDIVWFVSRGLVREAAILCAMAAGKPIVASDITPHCKLIKDGLTGWLITPGNVTDLTRRTDWFFDNPHYAAAFGKDGRREATKLQKPDDWLKQYLKLYEECLRIARTKVRVST